MNQLLIISILFLSGPLALGAQSTSLFGAQLEVFARDAGLEKRIMKDIRGQSRELSGTFDPDCFYKSQGNRNCGKNINPDLLGEITQVSKNVKNETLGQFNHKAYVKGKTYRDFGGISQGFVLEQLSKKYGKGWVGNFAGDVYLSPGNQYKKELGVADPFMANAVYAKIQMGEGWIMQSSSPIAGGKVRHPVTGKPDPGKDFLRVALFAKSGFSGARLDAWSTALILGGQPLLKRLWRDKKYAGQWGYFYFDRQGKAHCSKNIDCQLNNRKRRKIVVKL